MEIAYLHQRLGNYDLAIKLFQEAASRLHQSQSLKGVALYEVGRTMSWNDNWHDGYKFLKSTDATMELVNEDLKRNLKGVHAYYPYSEKIGRTLLLTMLRRLCKLLKKMKFAQNT